MRCRRWRVRVDTTDAGRVAVVYVTRRWWPSWYGHGAVVASVELTAPDANLRLAEARAEAASYARQITELEAARA